MRVARHTHFLGYWEALSIDARKAINHKKGGHS